MWQLNPNDQFLIETPSGWQPFLGIQRIMKPHMVEICFEEPTALAIKCSPDHPFIGTTGEIIKANDLIEGDPLPHCELGFVTVAKINYIPGEVFLYDTLNAGKDHTFYTNGLISHNCEFIGSSNTLIAPEALNRMATKGPVKRYSLKYSQFPDTEHYLDVHFEPIPKHQYVLTADVAGGKDQDSCAFIIFDISEIPYKVCAKYKSNKLSPMLFPDVIAEAATKYNMAFVLVETNDNDVAKTLQMDLEYENLITTFTRGKGTQVGGGFTKMAEFGLRTNKATKRIGCGNLKTLIEGQKLITFDYHIKVELTQFVSNNRGSYSAEEGANDDLAMCLVNFGWLVTQKYFKEDTDTDIVARLKRDYDLAVEGDVWDVGYIDSGQRGFGNDDNGPTW